MSTVPPPAPAVDVMAVMADMQRQLDALNEAVTAHQATIDLLVDEVIDLLKDRGNADQ
jgi:uncharacterized coiled-coil protein SlyX